MSISFEKLEDRVQEWIEKNADRLVGKPLLNELAHSLVATMKAHIKISLNGSCIAPSHYVIQIHPDFAKKQQLTEDWIHRLTIMLSQVAVENNITFENEPLIEVEADPFLGHDKIKVSIWNKKPLEDTARISVPVLTESEDRKNPDTKKNFLVLNGKIVFPLSHSVINIGRHPDNLLVISDPRVSRHHAQLRWIDNQYLLSDLNSSGGTFVNAKQIVQQILIPGDVISLAGFPIIYEESSDIEEISSDRGSSEKVDSKK